MGRWRLLLCTACLLLGTWPAAGRAQPLPSEAPADSAMAKPAGETPPAKKDSPVYYGGAIGLSIYSNRIQVSVQPFVGYRFTPKVSGGARVTFEYYKDSQNGVAVETINYGSGAFARYRLHRQVYAQTELSFMSYGWTGTREFVPFFLVGGGYAQPLGPKTWFTLDFMFDLLQDEGSPYKAWQPRVTMGISSNF